MSLNFGQTLLSIPGPSVIPERVLRAMHRASPDIYTGELIEIAEGLPKDLKAVACTKGDVAIYVGNGHAAWEAAANNVFNAGDKVLVIATGRFAQGWGTTARSLGIETEELNFGMHAALDTNVVADRLRADKDHRLKAVLVVQTDTATSARNDIAALRTAMDAANHPALLMVDCIASLGTEEHRMDDWGVDVMVSACQKGLMTPAGLSFVWFNEKAKEARKSANPSWYWDWTPRTEPEVFYHRFGGTAPTHHLYGLREALDILVHEEGIEAAWARHRVHARAVWAAVDAWGADGTMTHNIADISQRSFAVSAIKTIPDAAGHIRGWVKAEAGVTLGIGLALAELGTPGWDQQMRIGHMGHLNPAMVMATLGSIDAALKAGDIPHGSGALEAASRVLAKRTVSPESA